jgi:1-acyl-sn-glycerol-3-phosphate acyltransferase
MGWFRVGLTVAVLAIVTLALWPLQALAMRFDWPIARRLPMLWQRAACKVAGFHVTVEGEPAAPPLLIAANHVSWMDISVLGSVLPVSFIAKSEVGGWPVVRTLSRLQRSVYIERQKRTKTGAAAEAIASRVSRGDIMVLFAEGTTGDGARILPFRSALLGAARAAAGEAGAVTVQPVALTYLRIHGLPIGFADRPTIAWYGDMGIEDNFVEAVGWGSVEAVVSFGEPIPSVPMPTARRSPSSATRRCGRWSPTSAAAPSSAGRAGAGASRPRQKRLKERWKCRPAPPPPRRATA